MDLWLRMILKSFVTSPKPEVGGICFGARGHEISSLFRSLNVTLFPEPRVLRPRVQEEAEEAQPEVGHFRVVPVLRPGLAHPGGEKNLLLLLYLYQLQWLCLLQCSNL